MTATRAPDAGAADGDFAMNVIQQIEKEQVEKLSAGKEIPDFAPGDTVLVNVKVVEGDKSRIQAYEGVCIGRSGGGINENFTVRKISYGEGVERVFPLYSPMIDSIKLVRRGKVRRAKLYYLRGLRGKKARISEAQGAQGEEAGSPGAAMPNGGAPPTPSPRSLLPSAPPSTAQSSPGATCTSGRRTALTSTAWQARSPPGSSESAPQSSSSTSTAPPTLASARAAT